MIKMVKGIKSALWLMICLVVCGVNFSVEGKSALVWNLLWTQIEIWLNQRNSYSYSFDGGDVLSMQNSLEYRNNYDLVSELEKAWSKKNRLDILDKYITSISTVIATNTKMIESEKSESDKYVQLSNDCKNDAHSKNSEFSAAVKKWDYVTAQKIADEIAQLRSCEAINKVYAKEHMTYWSSNKNITKLQKKVDYISKNRDTIAEYYEILKPDLLKELYNISQTVKVNF